MHRGFAAAAAAVALLAAAPRPVPAFGSQTALVHRYVDALAAKQYGAAYALLDAKARAYFRTPENFAGVFAADALTIRSYAVTSARGNATFRVYFVREQVRLRDPAHDALGDATVVVPYGVIGSGRGARIKDVGHPWRAFTTHAAGTANGLRVRVQKVSFYGAAVALVVTFANVGDRFLTLLPYGKSVLRDDTGAVYRLAGGRQTDQRLFLGVHLAADAQITGVLSFRSPRLDDRPRRFTLTVAPALRDGADAPFSLDVTGIAPA